MGYVREDAYFVIEAAKDLPVDSVVAVGGLVGVTKFAYKKGDTAYVYLDGEYRLPKGDTPIAQGAVVYFKNDEVTTTASGATKLGVCSRAADEDDERVYVFLNR